MKTYVEFFKKYGKRFLILLIILNIVFFVGLFKIRINADFTLFMSKNSKYMKILDRMEEIFQSNDQFNVVIELDEDPYSIDGLKKIRNVEEKLKNLDGVLNVISPIPEEIPIGFKKIDVSEINQENYKYVVNFLSMIETDNITKKDGKYYVMFYVVPSEKKILKELDKVLQDIPHYFGGTRYLEEKIFDYLIFLIFTLPPAAIITVFLVFKWRLGSMKATFFSVFPAGIGALWTMGFLGWYKGEISILTILAPIFTIVMGSADGLHFVSHFLDLKENRKKDDALIETLRSTGVAMILTTVTTVVGFLSLSFINSESLAEMALISSIGISFAGIATWLFLPIILLNSELKATKQESRISSFFESFLGKKSIIVSLLLLIVFLPGLYMLNTEFYMIDMYKNTTEVKKNMDKIQNVFGISVPVYAYFETSFDPIEPSFANKVLQIEETLRNNGNKVISFYDLVSNINEKILKREGYPQNIGQARILLNLIPSVYENFLDRERKAGRVLIFPPEISKESLNKIESNVEEPLKVTGVPYIMKEMNEVIIPQQIKSLILAVFLVFIIVLIRFKNLKKAFVSIIPISLTLIVLFGFMGYARIKLSIITATMGSIVVGVGIDYAIHFVENFGYNYKKFKDLDLAIKNTFSTTSKPILANALGLAIGFSVLLLSPFKFHEYFVEITWISMLTSSFLSLTLLPTLLKIIYHK